MTNVLVLNFTYEALGTVDFRRAIQLVFSGKAEILHLSDREVRSPSIALRVPSIVRLLHYIRRARRRIAPTRKAVFARDGYRCAYCGARGGALTVDHVRPRSRDGASTWENLVCACVRCNGRKRDRTPEEAAMPLRVVPREPKFGPVVAVASDAWLAYLYRT